MRRECAGPRREGSELHHSPIVFDENARKSAFDVSFFCV